MSRTEGVDSVQVRSGSAGRIEAVTRARDLRWLVARVTAVVLATLVTATFVGRAEAFVYWTEGSIGTIGRANLDGNGKNLTFMSGLDKPQGIAIDGAHIYWLTGLGSIARANLDGTSLNENFILGAFAEGLAVDGAHIYWTTSGPNGDRIGRANLDGSGVNPSFMTTVVAAAGVAVDGAHIYWTNAGINSIGRANLDGSGANQVFISGAETPQGFTVDGAHIYWTNAGINSIGRANLDGSGANQVFISGAETPQGLTVDGAHIYWANSRSGTIGRANLDGTGANEFFIFAGSPDWVAVDGANIWWTNGSPFYAIGRANLDGTGVNQRFIDTLSTPAGVAVNALVAPSPGPGPESPTIARMVDDVQGLGLPRGVERSLLAKLGAAQANLDAGHLQAACNSLGAYVNEVGAQTDRRLDGGTAGELVGDATAIRQLVGCDAD